MGPLNFYVVLCGLAEFYKTQFGVKYIPKILELMIRIENLCLFVESYITFSNILNYRAAKFCKIFLVLQ